MAVEKWWWVNNPQSWETHASPTITPRQGVKWTVENLILDPKIETMSSQSIEVEVLPERWWLIKSIKIGWIEILYQDMYDETLLDTSTSVKWGIPYMFPNAGPLTEKEKSTSWLDQPQHGFARTSPWKRNEINKSPRTIQQDFAFVSTPWYPHTWKVVNQIKDEPNGVKITHKISNHWDTAMPIASGLHPYFRVPEWNKSAIKWDFPWWNKIAEEVKNWSNDGTVTFDNPDPGKPFSVIIPGLGRLELTASSDYKKFWVWSLPGKDFVCIEPVMWDEWMIANNPIILGRNESNTSSLKIDLFQD